MPKKLPKLKKEWFWPIGIFLLALLLRLFFIFIVTEPDNPGVGIFVDTYHRWQIAYLSREIGWPQEHRLWDLRGFEYLWGIVHPILLNILFSLTGRIDIWLARLLTALAGSGIAALFYLLGKRFFNFLTGLSAGLLAAFLPVLVMFDIVGLIEPLGVFFLLAAIWSWPKKPFLTGFFLAVAAASRIEAWILAVVILAGLLLFKRFLEKWVISFIGFLLPMMIYMKYLAAKTGSAIYPLKEYFFQITQGKWGGGCSGDLGECLINQQGLRFTYFLALPLGFLFSVFLFWGLPKLLKIEQKMISGPLFVFCLMLLLISQVFWQSQLSKLNQTTKTWRHIKQVGEKFWRVYPGKGRVLIPATTGDLTYSLVKYGGLEGKNIVGQGFDVFYYVGEEAGQDQISDWLKKEKIAWLIPGKNEYRRLIEKKPTWFSFVGDLNGYQLYQVHLP